MPPSGQEQRERGLNPCRLLVPVIPLAVAAALSYAALGVGPGSFVMVDDDYVYNWHQVATFRAAGLEGGYYTIDERPAPCARFRFGPHGPAFPALLGALTRPTGWPLGAGALVNLALLSAGLLAFVLLVRPARGPSLWIAGVVATAFPLWVRPPMCDQECLHYAFAMVAAGLLAVRLDRGPRAWGATAALGAVIVAASLFRFTWSPLLLPWAFLATEGRSRPFRAFVLGLAALAAAGSVALFRWWGAPTWDYLSYSLLEHMARNARILGSMVLTERVGQWTTHLHLWQLLQVAGLLALTGAVALRRPPSGADAEGAPTRLEAAVHLANVGAVLLATWTYYETGGPKGYRILAPHLLLSLLCLARLPWRRPLRALLVGALLLIPSAIGHYRAAGRELAAPETRARVEAFGRAIEGRVVYRPGADPWENTLLVDSALYRGELQAVPPGTGLSTTRDWSKVTPRSRYLLLAREDLPVVERVRMVRVLAETDLGLVCENLGPATPR